MLQVPCLSPPVYGHSHYKKFWLREATGGGGATMGDAGVPVGRRPKSSSSGTSTLSIVSSCPVDEITLSTEDHKCFYDCTMREASVLEEDDVLEESRPAAVDCLTSKSEDDRAIEEDEEEHEEHEDDRSDEDDDEEDEEDEKSSSEATSSTSQASDFEKSMASARHFARRRHSMKRSSPSPAANAKDDPSILKNSRTRAAAAAAAVDRPAAAAAAAAAGGSAPRTCTVCGTMKTPLWRNGPLGPKSLCNACGIRMRKAKRSSNAAAEGAPSDGGTTITVTTNTSPTSVPSPTSGNTGGKRKSSPQKAPSPGIAWSNGNHGSTITDVQLPYKKSRLATFSKRERDQLDFLTSVLVPKVALLGRTLPKDEQEGAVLLMALSCGLIKI